MSYAIVFSSKTGNTRLLADTLRASLPQNPLHRLLDGQGPCR